MTNRLQNKYWATRGRHVHVFGSYHAMVAAKNKYRIRQGNYAGFPTHEAAEAFAHSRPAREPDDLQSAGLKGTLRRLNQTLRTTLSTLGLIVASWETCRQFGIVNESFPDAVKRLGSHVRQELNNKLASSSISRTEKFRHALRQNLTVFKEHLL